MKNLISLENLVARNKIPLINAIFYPNGDLLVIDSMYRDDTSFLCEVVPYVVMFGKI